MDKALLLSLNLNTLQTIFDDICQELREMRADNWPEDHPVFQNAVNDSQWIYDRINTLAYQA